ncbi:MAG TPA: polysaccharide deacetylase family protein [Polyangia bacterium]|nr:polysaccharide deacetylase family protein [Polyangia bacterium]
MSVGTKALKHAVKMVLASPVGWRTVGSMLRQPGVIVLTYHRVVGDEPSLPGVSVANFNEQMRWLRANCDPIGPDDLMARARAPRSGRPAVLVTFDDGYRSYHDLAYPALKQHGIPALVFLVTGLVDEPGMLWTDRVQWAALTTPLTSVSLPWLEGGTPFELADRHARKALSGAARAFLKTIPDALRVERVEDLVGTLGGSPPRERQMVTWDEVRRTMDLTTFGGHTHTHCILSRVDRAGATREIGICRDRIAAETGKTPTYFAYPNGASADFTPETREVLQAHGFEIAFSTNQGIAGADSDWMAVKRVPGINDDVPSFVWQAAGLASGS